MAGDGISRTSDPPELGLDAAVTSALLIDFIRRETRKAGFRRAVLGLSGGVDSALAALLAARALGPRNLRCVLLPYRTSSPGSLRDARRVAGRIGARVTRIGVTPMIDAYFGRRGRVPRLRRGNAIARVRMAVLYDLSARDRALVLGTSNKTELLLGYGTVHGDLASGLNPLGDLYKTQVRRLALHLGLPADIAGRTPTADLWKGQTDEGEIGYSYDAVDRLLVHLVDRRGSAQEAVSAGFPRGMVRRITHLMKTTQYKRRTPIIAKVSQRTVGVDFLYPRDWGR